MDYIYQENFLDYTACDNLLKYFEQHINDTQLTNVNSNFDNRVIYYEKVVDPKIKNLMKNIHDTVAKKLTNFYSLQSNPIYPDATHIVKWPINTQLGNHADNAYENGEPNYVSWRSHSAVIYLNDRYDGGEFYFKKQLPDTIKPKKGLLLAFTAGLDHVHGVKIVKDGNRYALPMWFTHDKTKCYEEYQ